MFEGILGHKKQIEILEKSIQKGNLAHAYIFAGPSFIGKKTTALKFAHALLGISGAGYSFHPDLLEIPGEEGIKIESVREMIYKLSLRPYQAKYKIALIDNAHNMTVEAQNAILKVLEEPKDYTVMILVTSNPERLLRTITSRAQKINFGLVGLSDYESLISKNISDQDACLVHNYSHGRPGLANRITSDEEFVERLKNISLYYKKLRSDDVVEKMKLAYDLAELETAELKEVLEFWQIKHEQELYQTTTPKVANELSAINIARRYLDQNVNSKLLLTNLMLSLT